MLACQLRSGVRALLRTVCDAAVMNSLICDAGDAGDAGCLVLAVHACDVHVYISPGTMSSARRYHKTCGCDPRTVSNLSFAILTSLRIFVFIRTRGELQGVQSAPGPAAAGVPRGGAGVAA